jgi:hypothetical protein
MQTLEYRSRDKTDWGPGPWQDEPDKRQWVDEATGLPCLIVRNDMGGLCGYVGVADGHPLFGKQYGDVDIEVHGGLTFSDFCDEQAEECSAICHVVEPGENDRVWWLGFDCSHTWDLSPAAAARDRARGWRPIGRETYRDIAYVQAECASLARQLATL